MFEVECKRCGKSFKYDLDNEHRRRTTKIGSSSVCGLVLVLSISKAQFDLCPDCLAEIKVWYESGPAVKERMKQKGGSQNAGL